MSINNQYYVIQVKAIDFVPPASPGNPNPERIKMAKVGYIGDLDSPTQRRTTLGKEFYTVNADYQLFEKMQEEEYKIPGKFFIEFGTKRDPKGGATLFIINMSQGQGASDEQKPV